MPNRRKAATAGLRHPGPAIFAPRTAIPSAWRALVEEGNEDLVDIIAREAESKSGFRPSDEDVIVFLSGLMLQEPTRPVIRPARVQTERTEARPFKLPDVGADTRHGSLTLLGQTFRYDSAREAMVLVLQKLADLDPTFLQRCSQHPGNRGSKRVYIARSPEEIYPHRPDLWQHHETLPGEWVVATNISNEVKMKIIRLATEVAGLTLGKDVDVHL